MRPKIDSVFESYWGIHVCLPKKPDVLTSLLTGGHFCVVYLIVGIGLGLVASEEGSALRFRGDVIGLAPSYTSFLLLLLSFVNFVTGSFTSSALISEKPRCLVPFSSSPSLLTSLLEIDWPDNPWLGLSFQLGLFASLKYEFDLLFRYLPCGLESGKF